MGMDLLPPAYMNLEVDHEEETTVIVPPIDANQWLEEKTTRIDFDRPTLSSEEKLVFGYLTMEQHGIFGGLSSDEQQQIANTLKR